LQSQWYHANTFLPLKEENSKNDPEMTGPKVFIIKRFHCSYSYAPSEAFGYSLVNQNGNGLTKQFLVLAN